MLRRDGEVFFLGTAIINSSEAAWRIQLLSQIPPPRQQQWKARPPTALPVGATVRSRSTLAPLDQARQRGEGAFLGRRRRDLDSGVDTAREGRQAEREFLGH